VTAHQVDPESDTNTAVIYNADLTLTCYCHREVVRFKTPRLRVSYWDRDDLDGDFRVDIEMPTEGFHHAESYAIMIRGETGTHIFAFPFLEIQEIVSDIDNWLGWTGIFRSSPDKTGTHFATRAKEDSNDQRDVL
jgi:hypothetical protein